MSYFDEKIQELERLSELDDYSIDRIKCLSKSTDKISKESLIRNLVEVTIDKNFKDTEEIFMPYIREYKGMQYVINNELTRLQEKNLKRSTTLEDIDIAREIYLEGKKYLLEKLPTNLKNLSRIKNEYSLKGINRHLDLSLLDKISRLKVLAANYRVIKSCMEIYYIFEEELDDTFLRELISYLKIEIDAASRSQENIDIKDVYIEVLLENDLAINKIDYSYKQPKTYLELSKLAEENGFKFCRQSKTSHAIYKNISNKIVVIPNKGSSVVPIGTQLQILKRILI